MPCCCPLHLLHQCTSFTATPTGEGQRLLKLKPRVRSAAAATAAAAAAAAAGGDGSPRYEVPYPEGVGTFESCPYHMPARDLNMCGKRSA